MILKPIIPIWIMGIICILLILIRQKNKYRYIRQIIVIILLFLINMRIIIPSNNGTRFTSNIDIMFVIDNSISMIANDCENGTKRIDVVKKDCEYIMKEFAGARFSVVSFNDKSQMLIPFTKDYDMAIETVKNIQIIDELYAKGSSLNVPKDTIIDILKRTDKDKERTKVIFFISDGEITSDEKLESYKELNKYIDNGAVLGYGTKQGGQMKYTPSYSSTEIYIEYTDETDYSYKKAVSKIDEDNLKKIAEDIGIDYINMSKQSNINNKIKEIKNKTNISTENNADSYTETYFYFVIPMIIILVYELIDYKKKL